MNQSKIGVRYAKAFFEVARDQHLLDVAKTDMEKVAGACRQSDFKLLLESPVVKTSRKKAILKQIFQNTLNDLTIKFLVMLAHNKREVYLPDIARNFIQQYQTDKGIKAAKVVTATKLDAKTQTRLEQVIAELFKTELELTTETNPDIKGGFILRVGDQQIDASVSSKLKRIKRQFMDTTI